MVHEINAGAGKTDKDPHGKRLPGCGMAMLVLDRQLRITSCTPPIQQFMILDSQDTGRPLADIPLKFADPTLIPDCQRAIAQGVVITKEIHTSSDSNLQRGILPCPAVDGHICGAIVNYMDPGACQRSRQALKENQERLRAVMETAVDGIIAIDACGIINEFNPAAERMFGYAAGEVHGKNIKMLMPAPYHDQHDGYLARYRETGQAHIIGIGREVVALRKDGSEFPMELTVSAVGGQRKYYLGFIRDISQRRTLEKELLSIGEQAQRNIGQNLHDDIGQEMTALALKAETLQELLGPSGKQESSLAVSLVTGLDRTRGKIRTLARGLIPVPVDAKGLTQALGELASEISVTYNIICIFSCEETVSVSDQSVATHLYRIAQEAINNAIQHGGARHIRISLGMEDNHLRLEIEDDGIGMPDNAIEKSGMGLKIMRHRCGIIGGSLIIEPGDAYGTQVSCRVPLMLANG